MHRSYMLADARESCASTEVPEASGEASGENERLRRENDALRARIALLTRSNADLEQFAWAASHDLKEPLRTVAAYTQLLLRRRPPVPGSDEAEFGAFVLCGIERLHAMIDGLLAYARAGRGEEQPQISDTSVIVADAVEGLQSLMAERGASVSLAPLPPVAAASTPVFQVFSNLIGNAVKYSIQDVCPRIEIFAAESAASGSADPAMVRFAVRDNGIGIDAEYLERIFEPFQRLHGDEYPGIGLGLALSKRLVERYSGRIWAESTPGRGSTFYFTLPAAV
jgi:light-regulated signal transduction histidine kinase (bacteriophytochrome)